MYFWLGLAVVALLFWAWKTTQRPAWCPPGPPMLPFVGNMLSMDNDKPHNTYVQWARQFGDVYHVSFGAIQQVVLSDPALIREAYGRPELTVRPDTVLFQFIIRGTGLVAANGELWQQSRRLTLHQLRNLGMGKSSLEGYIHQQIGSFMDEILAPACGREIELDKSLNLAVLNIIWKMVASEELSITDRKIIDFNDSITKTFEFIMKLAALDAAPWVLKVLPDWVLGVDKVERQAGAELEAVLGPAVKKHKAELDMHAEPRDFLDAILQEQQKRPDLLTDWHVLMCVTDLFFAGSDTTAHTLRWVFCFLCSRPECQRRLQEEVDREVGHRLPSLADRQRLPYTEAVLHETQRLADVAPILVPHATAAPVTLGGYQIPAGVQVIGNAHFVHRNAELFPDPLEFRPERFLDADGKFRADKNVMPFSVGKRQCLGESLARGELFLFVTSILQKFSFRWPEGFQHDYSEKDGPNFLRIPAPYKIIPEKR